MLRLPQAANSTAFALYTFNLRAISCTVHWLYNTLHIAWNKLFTILEVDLLISPFHILYLQTTRIYILVMIMGNRFHINFQYYHIIAVKKTQHFGRMFGLSSTDTYTKLSIPCYLVL